MNRKLLLLIGVICFALSANAQIYSEDFESGIPADWTADPIWQAGNANTLSSQYFGILPHTNFVAVNDDAIGAGGLSKGYLTSGSIDLSGVTAPGVSMSFATYFWDADYQGADEIATVGASGDGGATWEQLLLVPGSGEWETYSVNLTQYIGGEVMIRFGYDDSGAWQYGYCVDDVVIAPLKEYEVGISRVPNDQFVLVGSTLPLSVDVQNNGVSTLTSFDIEWTDGTNSGSESVTGVNVAYGDSYTYSFPQGLNVANPNTYNIEFTISNPNGQVDEDNSNNTTSTSVAGVSVSAPKTVVAEEATGTWCGWCPRGDVFMHFMADLYPDDFVPIAVHNSDPMEVAAYDDGLTSTDGFSGFPSVIMDRSKVIDPSDLEAEYNLSKTILTPVLATQGISLDEGTRTLTVESKAVFNTNLNDHDIRFNVVVTENGVTGTGSGYNQVNYYSGGAQGQMGGFESLGNPVPAADMVYDFVGRALLGNYGGAANSIPSTITLGNEVSHTFTYVIPETYSIENMHVVTMVINNATGEILNAVRNDLFSFTNTNDEAALEYGVKVYPNPFSDLTNLEINLAETSLVSVNLYNQVGQLVSSKNYGELSGNQVIPVYANNLESGMYFLQMTINGNTISRKIQIVR